MTLNSGMKRNTASPMSGKHSLTHEEKEYCARDVRSTRQYYRKVARRRKTLFIAFVLVCIGCLSLLVCAISNMVKENQASEPTTPLKEIVAPTSETSVRESELTEATSVSSEVATPVIEEPFIYYYDVPLSHDFQDYIRFLCDSYEVPMDLVIAIMHQESSFRPDVISSTNDYGLMQINKMNHEWLSDTLAVDDFLDPYDNALCGIYILSGHLEKTEGDIAWALLRYNRGATGAYRLRSQGTYTVPHTEKILSLYEMYKENRIAAQTDYTAED